MKTKTIVTTHLDELQDYDWLSIDNGEEEELEFVNTPETIKKAAKAWGMTEAGVRAMKEALDYMAEQVTTQAGLDLRDVWEEVQKLKPQA